MTCCRVDLNYVGNRLDEQLVAPDAKNDLGTLQIQAQGVVIPFP